MPETPEDLEQLLAQVIDVGGTISLAIERELGATQEPLALAVRAAAAWAYGDTLASFGAALPQDLVELAQRLREQVRDRVNETAQQILDAGKAQRRGVQ